MSELDDQAPDPREYERVMTLLHEHLGTRVVHEPYVQAVEHDPTIPRWYVRFGGEGRDAATIYFDLHQRSLHYEIYFLPDPGRNLEALYRFLLVPNHDAYRAAFSLAPDGDIYLRGRCLLEHLDQAELDRIIGSLYLLTERTFSSAIDIADRKSTRLNSSHT